MSESYQHLTIEQLQSLYRTQQQNLAELERQKAGFGTLHVPLHVTNQIRDIQADLSSIDQELKQRSALSPTPYIDDILDSSQTVKGDSLDLQKIQLELQDLHHAAEDVKDSGYEDYEHNMQVFVSTLESGTALGDLINSLLPNAEFDTWYSSARDTLEGSVGSAKLNWPKDRLKKLSLQLSLMQQISLGNIDVVDFCMHFIDIFSDLDDNVDLFNRRVFNPFFRDLCTLIERNIK
jgi:hypothetical protein